MYKKIHILYFISLVEHEEGVNSLNFSFAFSLDHCSLSWHCTSPVRADWKSHMAGDKARAGVVCTLCRGSDSMPLHLKGSSALAECFHGCTYLRTQVWANPQPFVGVSSIQLELVTASGRVTNISNHLLGFVKVQQGRRAVNSYATATLIFGEMWFVCSLATKITCH